MRLPMSLPSLRKRIDRLDRQILQLLNQRAALALRVGRLKRARGLPVFDGRREAMVLRQAGRTNRGPLSHAAIQQIFRDILRHSRQLEAAEARRRKRPGPGLSR